MTDEPQEPGWRAHLDLAHPASRCGARRKRDGKPCCQPAMTNGRCRVHGGLSTGPRTPEGLQRSRRSNWKHGHYSAEAKRVRREARRQFRLLRRLIAAGNEDDVLDLISSMRSPTVRLFPPCSPLRFRAACARSSPAPRASACRRG